MHLRSVGFLLFQQGNAVWNNTGVRVNIDLDNLGKAKQTTVAPSMNQLARKLL